MSINRMHLYKIEYKQRAFGLHYKREIEEIREGFGGILVASEGLSQSLVLTPV